MPLECASNLPAVLMRLGTMDDSEIQVSFNLDTCAGMNTRNLRIHQYLITKSPTIVHNYEEYTDLNPFTPVSLEGVTSESFHEADFQSGKLITVVRYHARHQDTNTEKLLCFGLGDGIAVNGLIGLPTLRDWQIVLDIVLSKAYPKSMRIQWDMEFVDAAKGLPADIKFHKSEFVQPPEPISAGIALA